MNNPVSLSLANGRIIIVYRISCMGARESIGTIGGTACRGLASAARRQFPYFERVVPAYHGGRVSLVAKMERHSLRRNSKRSRNRRIQHLKYIVATPATGD